MADDTVALDIVALMEFGLGVISTSGGNVLLGTAANGYLDVMRYLVEQGVDINAKDNDGWSALILAARKGHLRVVRYLVEQGADVNAKGNNGDTALIVGSLQGHLDVVRYLVEQGADKEAKNNYGATALIVGSLQGHLDMVRYLVKQGVDVNTKKKSGNTALMVAAANGHLDVVRYLVEQGAGIEANKSETALVLATRAGNLDVVRYLVEQGADKDAKDMYDDTALIEAVRWGQLSVVRYLVEERGADVNATRSDGYTALMGAAENGHMEVVRYLAEKCDADVNATDKDGSTAIRLAADRGYQEIQRIFTPFLPPPQPYTSETTATNALSSDLSSTWDIPPSECALIDFVKAGNVGGEFLAKWLDADAVVKLYIPDASHTSFENEVRLWHQLRHPNVIKMHGACVAGPHLQFFVCEYASNGSLIEHVRSTPKDKRTIWRFLHQAALGLEYLHERKIVHGDLRCSNILIGSDGLSKLSNFGLSSSTNKSTQSSSAVGSIRWQSPEVLEGKPQIRWQSFGFFEGKPSSYASDVYSLGMCILEAATGKMPWEDKIEGVATPYKLLWTPERHPSRSYEPKRPPGDARDLMWRMCCNNPEKRASLSSVVYELERLAIKESCNHSQPEHEPACAFDDYKSGKTKVVWMDVQKRMENCGNGRYRQAFDELKRVRDRLQGSSHHPTLLARFHGLLAEFHQTITMSSEQARITQLSSTRATTNSVHVFHRRIESLWTALGESVGTAKERESRWKKQRSEQIEMFVSEASKTYLLLKELESAEERSAFLKSLKTEMEDNRSSYTPGQLEVMKKAYEDIASKLETDGLSELTPEWFIPWHELIVDKDCKLGSGGFGSVYRAKWLDSEVVVKQLDLVGSGGGNDMVQQHTSISVLSMKWAAALAPMNTNKRAEALAMFRREVNIWFGFSHPHVVRLFGACYAGRPFFVCEYATNGTLVSYLKKKP